MSKPSCEVTTTDNRANPRLSLPVPQTLISNLNERNYMYYKITVEECTDVEGKPYPDTNKVYEQVLPMLNVSKLAVYLNEPKTDK